MQRTQHKHYYTLNLIGYGLAKFDQAFVRKLGFASKQSLYNRLVQLGVAETTGVVKNRQDLFDPFFGNRRKGWWQKGNAYIHRKVLIDSLFGTLDVSEYSKIIILHLKTEFQYESDLIAPPIIKSKFKQLQQTGQEAELYFMHNYNSIQQFEGGLLEDARLLGDGYDFQIQVESQYFLAEVKGLKNRRGSVRLTEKEFITAKEFKSDYALTVVSDLYNQPNLTVIFNPIECIEFLKKTTSAKQISYHSSELHW